MMKFRVFRFIVLSRPPQVPILLFLSILRNAELKNKWIRGLNRQNKDKAEGKPSESDRVCSIHFDGSAYKANFVVWDKKSKKRKQEGLYSGNPLLKKVKLKKIMMSMMKIM